VAQSTDPLDTHIQLVTPENIAFRYQVAGPFRRLPAYAIDLALRVAFSTAVILVVVWISDYGLGDIGEAVWLLLFFLLSWFYGGVFEAMWNGQTPGKRWTRLRVLTFDGQPINASQAVLRNVLRAVDAFPALYVLGLITTAMNDRYQRLGDLVCGTMVVVEERKSLFGVTRINEPEVIRLAGYLPANYQIDRELSRALSAYVERRKTFSPGRRADVARHLSEPLRVRLSLPQGTDPDLLLCALYWRTYLAEVDPAAAPGPSSPQAPAAIPPVSMGVANDDEIRLAPPIHLRR